MSDHTHDHAHESGSLLDSLLGRWLGVLLASTGVVATLWLAFTGKLSLYIHPRYDMFTIIMSLLGAVATIGAIIAIRLGARRADDDHTHDHGESPAPVSRRSRTGHHLRRGLAVVGAGIACLGTIGALLVLPPTTLTTSTVDQRSINGAAIELDGEPIRLAGVDTANFTVRDWSQLLAQGADPTYFTGMTPKLVGFVTPDPGGDAEVFYVARFMVTCCAVDAQPVGVPVHLPGWRDRFAVDSWVEVHGSFVAHPSGGAIPVVVEPSSTESIPQPDNPYLT